MTFEQVKSEILELATQKNACKAGYQRAQRAKTKNGLIKVIKRYISWCVQNKIATAENLERWFEVKTLRKNHIYTSGGIRVLIYNSADVVVLGRAYVELETFKECSAYINTFDDATIIATAKERSTVNIFVHDRSSAKAFACDDSYTEILAGLDI